MPATDSQGHRATHPRLHIRNAQEAHTLFEAVRLGLLPIVRRRLSPTDRELQSGEVFVWEEASYKGGLERWTDGRKWSQSRMREPFLFYEEKAMPSREEKDAKAARRARKTSDPCSPAIEPSSPSPRRQDRPTKVRGLTKQTYSAYVTAPGSNGPPKKWHLTAYFCSTNYHELPVVTDDAILRTIVVPPDVYVTGKGLTRKNNTRGVGSSSSTPSAPSIKERPSSTQPHLHHGYSHPYPSPRNSFESGFPLQGSDDGSRSPWSSSSDAASAMPVTPPQHASGLPSGYYYPPPPPLPVGNPYYAAPQPQHALGNPYVYETAVPVVVDSTPRPPSTLPPLRPSPYVIDEKPVIVHATLPQPTSPPPQQYTAFPSIPPAPASPSASQQFSPPAASASVGYSTSDVRGESLPGDQSPPRYSARHSLDQRALGAFRLAL